MLKQFHPCSLKLFSRTDISSQMVYSNSNRLMKTELTGAGGHFVAGEESLLLTQ